jgi:hypothetical protein
MRARDIAVRAGAAAILCSACGHGFAQGLGPGMQSCGEFSRLYATNPTAAEDLFYTWAQGFISALNLSFVSTTGSYRLIDPNGTAAYKLRLRSYCDANPPSQYVQAIMDLYNSLPPALSNAK